MGLNVVWCWVLESFLVELMLFSDAPSESRIAPPLSSRSGFSFVFVEDCADGLLDESEFF